MIFSFSKANMPTDTQYDFLSPLAIYEKVVLLYQNVYICVGQEKNVVWFIRAI